ncbi:hypothetical protein [Nguyenibacter sp. L1]|uniref:hypothetical protein n=1 Tax=Nguyenibacter sp. L1 TaxID=3049350 RepID=UPI002B47EDDB|nr:hypothetical protein [Nguyenibacter sp. L1]WRH86489.1 hypothetical protein QN315_10625 [Nguyenibacter sp. L1]
MTYKIHNGKDVIGLMPEDFVAGLGTRIRVIKFPDGIPGPEGYGFLHVQGYDSRIKQVQGLGYPSIVAYVADVCSGFSVIRKNEKQQKPANGPRFLLGKQSPGYEHIVVVELKADCWEVVTAIPGRRRREAEIWKREDAGGSEPAPEKPEKLPRFSTLSLPLKGPGQQGS